MKVARCPLKYSTQPSRSKLLSGKPRYIGRVHHNQTLTREEIVKGLAAAVAFLCGNQVRLFESTYGEVEISSRKF